MGYMEGNMSGMDYSYASGASHYPLWKPASGYFPRGEAPPPYEEAVAISQAEALSAQCTVSVATTAHRAMGLNATVTPAELTAEMRRNMQQQQQQQQQQQTLVQQHAIHLHQPSMQHNVGGVSANSGLGGMSNSAQAMQHHVGPMPSTAPQQQHHQQSHNQITQSTTNLINININSGGNVTTIATGENHQPPYSLQHDSSSNVLQEPQHHQHITQSLQQQQQQPHLINTTHIANSSGGRLHLTAATPSNSICVQTLSGGGSSGNPSSNQSSQIIGPNKSLHLQQQQQHHQLTANVACQALQQAISSSVGSSSTNNECSYKNCHLNISATSTSASAMTGTQQRRTQQRTTLPSSATHVAHDMLQQFVTVADVEINGTAVSYHSLPSGNGVSCVGDGENDLFSATTTPAQYAAPHMSSAISTPTIDVLPLMSGEIATISNNTSDSITQTALSAVAGSHTLPTNAHTQTLKSGSSSTNSISSQSSKTPSSSRRYHRTIPRYFALTDPLSAKEVYGVSKSKSDNSSRVGVNSSSSTNTSNSKKPTCQCPVQHVPMSYMAATQLTNVAQCANNSALLSALSTKLNAACQSSAASQTSSASSTLVTSHGSSSSGRSNTITSLGYTQRAKSSNSLQQSSANDVKNCFTGGGTLKRTTHNISTSTNNNNTNSNAAALCSYDTKIATISKQVGDSTPVDMGGSTISSHHHAAHHTAHAHHSHHAHSVVVLPTQIHDESMPIVLGRVQKRSSGERERERDRERERERERERARSASSGRASSSSSAHHMESSAAAIYLNGKSDAYLNFPHPQNFTTLSSQHQQQHNHHQQQQTNDTNPILPPKLHKSLTNLKSTTNNNHSITNATTSTTCAAAAAVVPTITPTTTTTVSSSCTAVQTVYTLSKATTTTSTHSTRKEHQNIHESAHGSSSNSSSNKNSPPSLTLPLSPAITNNVGCGTFSSSGNVGSNNTHSTEKPNKINSSTFYPLQNSHVTYTLPKHISGKVSLNSTIASVVSKVPSVISIPVGGGEVDLYENNNGGCANNAPNLSTISIKHESSSMVSSKSAGSNGRSTTLPKILRAKKLQDVNSGSICNSNSTLKSFHGTASSGMTASMANASSSVSQCKMPAYPQQYNSHHGKKKTTTTTTANATTQFNSNISESSSLSAAKHLPVCTTSKNCHNPKEHFLPNDTSLDDDYLSECENCKIAQSAKYYLNAEEVEATPQETMTLQRKSMEDNKDEQEQAYYRISHTLPTNPKKNAPIKNNNREPWFSTIPASSSSEEDVNE